VEKAWGIIDPFVQSWSSDTTPSIPTYPQGNWGPAVSDTWMRTQGRSWFDLCPVLK